MKIYLASSWRNQLQPIAVKILRGEGFEVYDFRNPGPGKTGFNWKEVDPHWETWTPDQFKMGLSHPLSVDGFRNDWEGMQWADVGLCLLPSGRSAHLEAGYFVGAKKRLMIVMPMRSEPELMYKMADAVCVEIREAVAVLKEWDSQKSVAL